MVPDHPSSQRIARLAPLADVLAWIDANVRAVTPREMSVAEASGYALANDVSIQHAIPPRTISLRDGYALQSDWTSDASSYAPAPLPQMPARVDVGEPLPAGADCVAALDHVAIKGDRAEALAVVAPGEGILPVGGTAAAQTLLPAGRILDVSGAVILRAANISRISVRAPRIAIVQVRADDAIIAAAAQMTTRTISLGGGIVKEHKVIDAALQDKDVDAVFVIGGTGAGRKDASVSTLAGAGKVAFHGIGLMPGDTAAIGEASGKPVLLIPGRIDAALACWLVLGRRLLARLAGGERYNVTMPLTLTRKITSTIGIADVVLLKQDGGSAEPVAAGCWSMEALGQANFYCVVPPESEGFPAGATISASLLS